MADYIDAHTHIHMTAAESRAFLERLHYPVRFEGTAEESLPMMDRAGIRTTMIVPWIPARQLLDEMLTASAGKRDREALLQELGARWSTYNRWAAQTSRQSAGRFTTLVAVDPVLFGEQWTRQEIDTHLREGAIGLKITPLFIGAYADDPRMSVLWEEANRRQLGVLTLSTGPLPAQAMSPLGLTPAHTDINHPRTFEPILKAYPRCRIVLAHMGSGAEVEVARLTGLYPNLFCDTSMWLDHIDKPGGPSMAEAVRVFRDIGTDRILFGTNYPIMDPGEFINIILRMPLGEDERRQILVDNFTRAYG
jgi:predicted TIM-barrel fold metal-dependent hydrolase